MTENAAAVFAAVDIGASGGRVMRATVSAEGVALEAVHRFPNGVVEIDDRLRWDFEMIEREVRAGLAAVPEAVSIGIDTWGVDYGLLGHDGQLLASPVSYRDDRTAKVIDDVHRRIPASELYAVTGIQHLPFNTIYQLFADDQLGRARHAVLVPDLLAYRLTGELRSELTNASTTGLLDAGSQDWSDAILQRLNIPRSLLPAIERPGTLRGSFHGTAVVTVGSHDTASAVAGVPSTDERFAYVACGTWSLVGVLTDTPVLTDSARRANFTNEVAVDGRIRFLRNVGGLWLLQECLRSWQRDDLEALLSAAAALAPSGRRIEVDDPAFIPPGNMPARIAAAAGDPNLSPAQTVRCILDSLADGFAATVRQASALTGQPVEVVHIVGGGSQNELLCQLTADAAGLPVVAGPTEATALGNVLVQARAAGLQPSLITTSWRYEPR